MLIVKNFYHRKGKYKGHGIWHVGGEYLLAEKTVHYKYVAMATAL